MPKIPEIEQWQQRPEWQELPDQEKESILSSYFNSEIADDEFASLDPDIQKGTVANFIKDHLEPQRESSGDTFRGAKTAFQQMPQLFYGLVATGGAIGESVFGEGGISTDIKTSALEGYKKWSDKIESVAKESDSFTYSFEKARAGDYGALIDWAQYGLGYVGAQALTMLTGVGAAEKAAEVGLKGTIATVVPKMVAKEAARITAESVGKKLAKDEVLKLATKLTAQKIGQRAALASMAFGMEGGEIGGEKTLEATEKGERLSGKDIAKIIGGTVAAGSLEYLSDKIGLDVLMGRSGVYKGIQGLSGVSGRAARAAIGGGAVSATEGSTEFGQTLAEESGKGRDMFSAESFAQARDAAALGALGGIIGAGGGAMTPAKVITDDIQKIGEAGSVDEAIDAFSDSVSRPIIEPNREQPQIYRDVTPNEENFPEPYFSDRDALNMDRAARIRNTMAITPESAAPDTGTDLLSSISDSMVDVQSQADQRFTERTADWKQQEDVAREYTKGRNKPNLGWLYKSPKKVSDMRTNLEIDRLMNEGEQVNEKKSNIPEDIRDAIGKMERDLAQGEKNGTAYDSKSGETAGWASTNPEWFKNDTVKKYDKKYGTSLAGKLNKMSVAATLSKVRSGKPLTGNQNEIWAYIQETAANLNNTDTELVAGQEADKITEAGIDIGPKRTVVVGDLNEGDKVVIENKGIPDVVEHKGYDEEGNTILEDGKRFTVDQFDKLDIYGEKKAEGLTKGQQIKSGDTDLTYQGKDAMGLHHFIIKSDGPANKANISTTTLDPDAIRKATDETVTRFSEGSRIAKTLGKEDMINGITRAQAGDMLADGDEAVLGHIREGMEKHGKLAMEDAIRNQEITEVAGVPKDQRGEIKEKIAKLKPQIDEILNGSAAPSVPATTPARVEGGAADEATTKQSDVPSVQAETRQPEKSGVSEVKETPQAKKQKESDVKYSRAPKSTNEDKNLYVAHNLSAQNLRHALGLGGLAAPSLAVGNIDASAFTAFGEITLLADPTLLFSPKTKVFDADVYSPRHPQAVHVIDNKALDKFNASLGETYGLDKPYISDLEESRGADRLLDNYAVKLSWLRGQGITVPLKKEKVSSAVVKISQIPGSSYSLEQNPQVAKIASVVAAKDLANIPPEVREEIKERWFDEDGQVKKSFIRELVSQAMIYRSSGGHDTYEIKKAITKKFRNTIISEKYENYIGEVFSGLVKERKLFKGFTNQGNRKYAAYNLDNLVAEMTKQLRGGEGFNYGAGSIRSAFAKQFKSISEIQKNRDRVINESEMNKIKEESQEKLMELLDELKPFYKYDRESFGYYDDASQAIAEGPKGLREAFNLDVGMHGKIREFTDYLRNLPTEYFEAKMQRAVNISEFNAAVVPKGTAQELVDALKLIGLDVRFYRKGDNEDRLSAVRKTAVLFSRAPKSINTVEAVTSALSKNKRVAKLIDSGGLNIVQSADDLPSGALESGVGGAYDPASDTMVLVSDGIEQGKEERVLEHEALHRANVKGELKPILDELRRIEKMAGTKGTVAEWFRKAREAAQVDKGTPHYIEEIGAYAVQNYEQSPNIIKRWVDKLVAKVRAILFNTFGMVPKNITPAFLREIALSGLKADFNKAENFDGVEGIVKYSKEEVIKQAKAFYSKLAEISDKFTGMKAQGVENFLLKHGVKKTEIEATGLREWLAGMKPTDKVSSSELSNFVKSNMVELDDVVLGEPDSPKMIQITKERDELQRIIAKYDTATANDIDDLFNLEDNRDYDSAVNEFIDEYSPSDEDFEKIEELQKSLYQHTGINDGGGKETKFSDYQEPGAEDGSYREMFVVAPGVITKSKISIKEYHSGFFRAYNEKGDIIPLYGEDGERYEAMSEGKARLAAERYINKSNGQWQDGHSQYQDIKNPIVRIRFNTRTDTQGRKILFIEEMQGPSKSNQEKMPGYLKDNIYQLGVKRILAYAKGNGFDGVSWTSGDMQADRYDLSKQVDEIDWSRENKLDGSPGKYTVSAAKDGAFIDGTERKGITIEQVENLFGKNIADQILEAEGKYIDYGVIKGDGLRVGGEGLKRLYDADLPNLFKAYGKEGVEETTIASDKGSKKIIWEGKDSTRPPTLFFAQFLPITDKTPESYTLFSRVAPIIEETFDVPEKHTVAAAIKGAFDATRFTKDNAKKTISKARTQLIDKLHPIEQLGDVPYKLHSLLNNTHAVLAAFLQHGKLSWQDGALTIENQKDKGFLPWLHAQKEEGRNLFYWIAVKRAEKLEAEGRENHLTKDKRDKIRDDQVFKGLNTADRAKKEAEFERLNKEFQEFNKNIIDISIEAGLLSKDQVDAWMKDFYLPFYRILEDETTHDEFMQGPHKQRKFISAQIKRLKGGEEKLGDPLENILRNWTHLIQESQRNVARSSAAEVAINLGLAEKVPGNELFKSAGARRENFIVSYQDNGKSIFLKVNDVDLFEALSNANAKVFDSKLLKVLTGAKRLLTAGATFTPAFRFANMFRDTIHTSVVSKSFFPFLDTAKGFMKVWREDADYVALSASGGGFSSGYIESGDPKAMARGIEKILEREGKGARGNILDTPRRILEFWEKVGTASEMAARVQLYNNLKMKGETHMEAAFQARDLMDFYKSGAGNAVRVIMATTPFLNARIQGLDRLYRGAKEDPKAFFVKGALVAGASLLLWAAFKDDERYKELEDWEKWQYHHFWIGDTHFRMPKAFEVGAIFSSLFESAANVIAGQEDMEFFWRFLGHTLTQTFALSFPAAVGPSIEVYANKSAFTGRAIESMGQEKLPPGERSDPWTPEVLRDLGKATNISPKKMEHIIRGHTAAFGLMFVTAVDALYRRAIDAPPRPAMRINDIPGIGRFVQESSTRTKYATRYYDFVRELDMLSSTISNYKNIGDYKMAHKLAVENKDTLRYKTFTNKMKVVLTAIRKQEKLVWSSSMSPEKKRDKLRELQNKKNNLLQSAYKKVYK